MEYAIYEDNGDEISANVIMKLANDPATSEGDQILFNKGVMVVPDILANAGRVA